MSALNSPSPAPEISTRPPKEEPAFVVVEGDHGFLSMPSHPRGPKTADVSINAGTEPDTHCYILHLRILALNSVFFDGIWKKKQPEELSVEVDLPHITPAAFKTIRDYLYKGTFDIKLPLNLEYFMLIYKIADDLGIQPLRKAMRVAITKQMDVDNDHIYYPPLLGKHYGVVKRICEASNFEEWKDLRALVDRVCPRFLLRSPSIREAFRPGRCGDLFTGLLVDSQQDFIAQVGCWECCRLGKGRPDWVHNDDEKWGRLCSGACGRLTGVTALSRILNREQLVDF